MRSRHRQNEDEAGEEVRRATVDVTSRILAAIPHQHSLQVRLQHNQGTRSANQGSGAARAADAANTDFSQIKTHQQQLT